MFDTTLKGEYNFQFFVNAMKQSYNYQLLRGFQRSTPIRVGSWLTRLLFSGKILVRFMLNVFLNTKLYIKPVRIDSNTLSRNKLFTGTLFTWPKNSAKSKSNLNCKITPIHSFLDFVAMYLFNSWKSVRGVTTQGRLYSIYPNLTCNKQQANQQVY